YGDRAIRRREPAGDELGREGRHRHQLRTAHLARARRAAETLRGAPRLGDRVRLRAAARTKIVSGTILRPPTCAWHNFHFHHAGGELERASRADAWARSGHHGPQLRPPRAG